MKALIISDTHGDIIGLRRILERYPDLTIFHLGDLCAGQKILPKNAHIVAGNCDLDPELPKEKVLEFAGKRIMLTHGDRYRVKSGQLNLYYHALEQKIEIVLFGHTHFPVAYQHQGIIFINPGSTFKPRGIKEPTYAILHIIQDTIEVNYYNLEHKLIEELSKKF